LMRANPRTCVLRRMRGARHKPGKLIDGGARPRPPLPPGHAQPLGLGKAKRLRTRDWRRPSSTNATAVCAEEDRAGRGVNITRLTRESPRTLATQTQKSWLIRVKGAGAAGGGRGGNQVPTAPCPLQPHTGHGRETNDAGSRGWTAPCIQA
jgi:hypothetical protein